MTINKLRSVAFELAQSIPTHPDWRLQTTPSVNMNTGKYRTLAIVWKGGEGSIVRAFLKIESVFKASRTIPIKGNGNWSVPLYYITAGVLFPNPGFHFNIYTSNSTLDEYELKIMLAEWLDKSPLGVPVRLAMMNSP